VTDHGIGIPPEHLDRIFERFHRVDNSATREIGGTGLGLAICKRIVEQHGGQITVQSREGEGSTFTVMLPAA
jgi:signal transduction histidine kinase